MTQYAQVTIAGGGMKLVSTGGTAVALATTSILCMYVDIQAISTNTVAITVCNSTALTTSGANHVGVNVWPGSTSAFKRFEVNDVQNLYIDGLSTEGIYFTYYRPTLP